MTSISHPTRHAARTALVAHHPLAVYFVLAYVFSWSVEIPLAASAQGWIRRQVPFALHYLAGYGPLLAAVVATWMTEGTAGLRELGARVTRWRVRPVWWVVAVSPLLLYGATAVALRVQSGTWTDIGLLGRINFLPNLGVGAWPLWLLTFGIGEETGWRGFALPRLQRHGSALRASLIVAGFWIVWHLPTLLYLPTYMRLGPSVLPGFALGIASGAIVFTWLYNSGGGSILLVALGHATLNFVTASPSGNQIVAAVISTAVIIWAVAVIFIWGPATLSSAAKQTH